MLYTYFNIAWRNIRRQKVYTAINILGLALGISACLVIYLITHYELSFDRSHPDGQRIYRLVNEKKNQGPPETEATVPAILPLAARQEIPGLETVAAYHIYRANVRAATASKALLTNSTIIAESSYFSIFKYEWLAGNQAAALKVPFTVVLTEASCQKYFGTVPIDRIIGAELIYNDSLRVRVSGVVKDQPENTDFPYTDFISFSTIQNSFLQKDIHLLEWGNTETPWTSRVFVKLDKNVLPARVNAALTSLVHGRIKLQPGEKYAVRLQALSDIHFDAVVQDGIRKVHKPTLYVLMGIALFILLLAVVNFINLSTAMSIRRVKEIGIRKVLGSHRSGLILQFLVETGIICGFAMLLSLSLVNPILSLFHAMLPEGIVFSLFKPDILVFVLLLVLLTTLLAGLYPARLISAHQPASSLKGNSAAPRGEQWRLREGLIVFQFTISLIFIISTIIIGRQINYMRNEDLGFSSDAILTIDTDMSDHSEKSKILAARLRRVTGVSMVARQSFSPITQFHTTIGLQYKGGQVIDIPAALLIGDEHLIPLYQMKLLAGVNIRHSDSLKEVVINESMARAMGFSDPAQAVGKFLYDGGRGIPVLGVVADFHEYSYHEGIRPIVISDISQPETSLAVKLQINGRHPAALAGLLQHLRKEWEAVYPGQSFVWHFLDDTIAAMYDKEEKTALLMNTAMIMAIFISCMGLFGLAMFMARQRTKEIGIRKILGATAVDIASMLTRGFVRLVMIAVLAATPIAWYCMHLWLQNFSYKADISPLIFVTAGLGAMLIALLTVSWQTVRAAIANPVESLRTGE